MKIIYDFMILLEILRELFIQFLKNKKKYI
jgi:hypothetical protein